MIWTGGADNGRFGWEGRLAKGDHTITLEAWDDNPDNTGQSTSIDLDVVVTNSNSRSVIASLGGTCHRLLRNNCLQRPRFWR